MDKGKKTAKTVIVVLIINLLSRALALFANAFITAIFGATELTSAYTFALSVTNTITTVIGTALTTAVIPIYMEHTENGETLRADKFINNIFSLTVIIGGALAVVGGVVAPLIAKISSVSNGDFSVFAIRMMLPAIIFISVGYILSGVLQAKGDFFSPAMISLPSSIVNIIYIILLSKFFGIYGLVVSTLTGFFVQAVYLIGPLYKKKFKLRPSFDFKNPDITRVFKLTAPVLIGVAAYQINILTNNAIAFSYNSEKFVVLSNVQNLGIQIVLTLVLASTSVIYPMLTSCAVKKDYIGFSSGLNTAVNMATCVLVPIGIAFYVLSNQIVDIVYGYGKFGPEDVSLGANLFSIYALCVVGIALKEICDRSFYAINNTKIPAYNGLLIMVINIALSFILVKPYGFAGIAAAYSIAALIGGFTVYGLIIKKIKANIFKSFIKTFLKAAASGVVMALVIKLIIYIQKLYIPLAGKFAELVCLFVIAVVGAICYFIMLYILKTKELSDILNAFGLSKLNNRGDCH